MENYELLEYIKRHKDDFDFIVTYVHFEENKQRCFSSLEDALEFFLTKKISGENPKFDIVSIEYPF